MSLRALGILRSLVIEASGRCVDEREMCAQVELALALLEKEPAARWESMALAGVPQGTMNQLGQEGWEPYAAAFNADGKQVIWMKRRLG